MSLPSAYLKYPKRARGMDHDLYPYSNLFARKPVMWPRNKPIALWITVALEYFPLTPSDTPFRAPGSMVTPYPDLRTYTARDYGNRVGIFRILKVLDKLGLRASFPTSAALTKRTPFLIREIKERGHEFIGHGMDMNALHFGGMDKDKECEQIKCALDTLRAATGQKITGWLSPARSESEHTLDLLPEHGVGYVCDWVNDDMPYTIGSGEKLIAMPHTMELEDRRLLVELGQNERIWHNQITAAFDCLLEEAQTYGGRILHVSLTPYVMGQAWRIQALSFLLQTLTATGRIWSARGDDIVTHWLAGQNEAGP